MLDETDNAKFLLIYLLVYPLAPQATSALELSDGEAMAEALVKIDPTVFTPTWLAGEAT